MFCKSCGKEIPESTAFCQHCGAPVEAQTQQYQPYNYGQPQSNYQQPEAPQQPYGYQQPGGYQQQPPYGYQQPGGYQQQPYGYQQPNPADIPSGGFNALSFFFPIVGLILFLVWKDQTPVKAKSCGKWALIGFIISMVFNMIVYIASFAIGYTYYI